MKNIKEALNLNKFNGVGASDGVAIAKIFILKEVELNISKSKTDDSEYEIGLLEKSIKKTKKHIEKLKFISSQKFDEKEIAIFDAHIKILEDPVMLEEIKYKINNEKINAAFAVKSVSDKYINMFNDMDDLYFRERANDVKDVMNNLIRYVLGVPIIDLSSIDYDVVIVSEDLSPSQVSQLNTKFIKGFACDAGGATSHVAILARNLGIPAVLGLKNITKYSKNNEKIIINGCTGEVIINPTLNEINKLFNKYNEYVEYKSKLLTFKDKKTISKDGYKGFLLEGNIGSVKDIENVISNGGEGVGLFRSEFLYMNNDHFPTEDEQFESYKSVLEKLNPYSVIIRTLDIGGDKHLSYFNFPEEINPALGYRAIRLCLDKQEIFRVQLRALIRASNYGKLGIMFPMITTIDEFKSAKKIFFEEKEKLIFEGYELKNNIEIGMMIEVPSAAIIADKFAKYVDFFSIGTNDLIQYTMATDRMNQHVSYLYQPYNPAILRLLKLVIDRAHDEGKWVGMCGEMACDTNAVPLLMGMKLDCFSMSASSILNVRRIISKLDTRKMKLLVDKVLECETSEEVLSLVKEVLKEIV